MVVSEDGLLRLTACDLVDKRSCTASTPNYHIR
jgi:hypothetical protein